MQKHYMRTLRNGLYLILDEIQNVKEFQKVVDNLFIKDNLERAYQKYVAYGSFPYISNLEAEKNQIYDYLKSIYDTIILKDVINRKKITDVMMLESVIRFGQIMWEICYLQKNQ